MTSLLVFEISQLAKRDPMKAETALLELVRKNFTQVSAQSIKINDSKLSLNSVNGIIIGGQEKFFFKFHTEENEQVAKNLEYYNAELLKQQGLPMIMPLYAKTEPGSQFLVYPYISYPTAFEEYEKEELKFLENGIYDKISLQKLLKAEKELLGRIRKSYFSSLALRPSREIKDAAINQLFYNRLVGRDGLKPRLGLYYRGKKAFDELANLRWVINGIEYQETLNEIIGKAKELLNPVKMEGIPTVIGHGDDHNGNKFFTGGSFVFFDPAFAGRQPALLSFVKATAHNVFLHPFWLYESKRLDGLLKINIERKNKTIIVKHNWDLEQRSSLRLEILELYAKELWKPLLQELKQRGWLPPNWKEYIRKALFCCPFLVTNLIDAKKYNPEQSLLALSMCVMLGSSSAKPNIVSKFIQSIEPI